MEPLCRTHFVHPYSDLVPEIVLIQVEQDSSHSDCAEWSHIVLLRPSGHHYKRPWNRKVEEFFAPCMLLPPPKCIQLWSCYRLLNFSLQAGHGSNVKLWSVQQTASGSLCVARSAWLWKASCFRTKPVWVKGFVRKQGADLWAVIYREFVYFDAFTDGQGCVFVYDVVFHFKNFGSLGTKIYLSLQTQVNKKTEWIWP